MKRPLIILLWFGAALTSLWSLRSLLSQGQAGLVGPGVGSLHNALVILSLLVVPVFFFWMGVREARRYRRWQVGLIDHQDIEEALARASPPVKRSRMGVWEGFRATGSAIAEAVSVARTRWPSRKGELAHFLKRPWKRQERIGLGIILGGEVLFFFLAWEAGRSSNNVVPAAPYAALVGLVFANLLILLFWLAWGGEDDGGGGGGGGGRPPQGDPALEPGTGPFRLRTSKGPRVPGRTPQGSTR